MKSELLTLALLLFSSTPALAAPQPITDIQLLSREDAASIESRNPLSDDASELWKRKGGGGGGGKGGSSGSSSSGKGSSSSASGGATKQGSGKQPSYGGGKYYGGGAKAPYQSGGRSPSGIAPIFLGAAALSIIPGIWLYGAYAYPYHNPYHFYNRTARRNSTQTNSTAPTRRDDIYAQITNLIVRQDSGTGANETKPVQCLCSEFVECGCDDSGDTTFLDGLIGDGTWATLDHTVVNVVDINGTSTIVLNGTLDNGTTVAGGTEDVNGTSGSGALQASSFWVLIAVVGCSAYFI